MNIKPNSFGQASQRKVVDDDLVDVHAFAYGGRHGMPLTVLGSSSRVVPKLKRNQMLSRQSKAAGISGPALMLPIGFRGSIPSSILVEGQQ